MLTTRQDHLINQLCAIPGEARNLGNSLRSQAYRKETNLTAKQDGYLEAMAERYAEQSYRRLQNSLDELQALLKTELPEVARDAFVQAVARIEDALTFVPYIPREFVSDDVEAPNQDGDGSEHDDDGAILSWDPSRL